MMGPHNGSRKAGHEMMGPHDGSRKAGHAMMGRHTSTRGCPTLHLSRSHSHLATWPILALWGAFVWSHTPQQRHPASASPCDLSVAARRCRVSSSSVRNTAASWDPAPLASEDLYVKQVSHIRFRTIFGHCSTMQVYQWPLCSGNAR